MNSTLVSRVRSRARHLVHASLVVVSLTALSVACSDDDTATADGATPVTEERDVAAKPSAGCEGAAPSAVRPGEEKVTLAFEGGERWFYRHVPSGYAPTRPVPVVLDFHGYSSGADLRKQQSLLGPFGDAHAFATITPHGLGERPGWDTDLDSADLRLVGTLIDEVDNTMCVDENRIFVTGFSNGADMTSSIACVYTDRVAAIAPVGGIRATEGCRPASPVPVVTLHGTADPFADYDGGLGPSALALPAPDGSGRTLGEVAGPEGLEGPSVPDSTAAWARRNGCVVDFTESRIADDVDLIEFDCPPHADAQLYRIKGGGHTWPGSELSRSVEDLVGHTTFSISANEVIWEFFVDHPLRDD